MIPAMETALATSGPLTFARFALPPNQLGYCGPSASALGDYLHRGTVDGEIAQLAQAFEGAWPYLCLIAQHAGIADPLDARVVEAYWLGGPLAARVDVAAFGNAMRARFASRAGWTGLADVLSDDGGTPTHAYHVFCVYPWLGLLRAGAGDPALHVLDRCRIRAGTVVDVIGPTLAVATRPLQFERGLLRLGHEQVETVTAIPGLATLDPGDRVALHWDWACAKLNRRQSTDLGRSQTAALRLANRSTSLDRLTE